MSLHSNILTEFLRHKIGMKDEKLVPSFEECIVDDVARILNTGSHFSLFRAKTIIFQYSDWPPYIHEEEPNIDYLIRDRVAEEFLQLIAVILRTRGTSVVFHADTHALVAIEN